jgi:hypothetical protein
MGASWHSSGTERVQGAYALGHPPSESVRQVYTGDAQARPGGPAPKRAVQFRVVVGSRQAERRPGGPWRCSETSHLQARFVLAVFGLGLFEGRAGSERARRIGRISRQGSQMLHGVPTWRLKGRISGRAYSRTFGSRGVYVARYWISKIGDVLIRMTAEDVDAVSGIRIRLSSRLWRFGQAAVKLPSKCRL